jgi:DNA invertase Pin-like site-specific DNA recombinase
MAVSRKPYLLWILAPERKPIAERLYKQGFTEEQIATQLGVTKATISNDLANCLTTKQSKPAKTASNPKGAGRPKGRDGKARGCPPKV